MRDFNISKILTQLVSVQIFAKLVTFPVNFLTERIVSKDTYGYAHI